MVTALAANSAGIALGSEVDLSTAAVNGNITLTVDSFTLAGTNTTDAGSGIVTITPRTVGRTIEYGDVNTALVADVYYSSAWTGFTAGSYVIGSISHEGNITLTRVAAARAPLAVRNAAGGAIEIGRASCRDRG